MSAFRSRLLFVAGAGVGAAVGIGVALRASGLTSRSTRDELQQALEAVLFRVLDMTPFAESPTDYVVGTKASAAAQPAPVDIVLGSEPSDMATGGAS